MQKATQWVYDAFDVDVDVTSSCVTVNTMSFKSCGRWANVPHIWTCHLFDYLTPSGHMMSY